MSAKALARWDVVEIASAPEWGEHLVVSIEDDGKLGVRHIEFAAPDLDRNEPTIVDDPRQFVFVRRSTPEERK